MCGHWPLHACLPTGAAHLKALPSCLALDAFAVGERHQTANAVETGTWADDEIDEQS